jgi:mRNA interferase MazF
MLSVDRVLRVLGDDHPFPVMLPAAPTGLQQDSDAPAEQVRAVAVQRILAAMGVVPAAIMDDRDEAFRVHLSL